MSKTVLVATDFSEPADRALELGLQWAQLTEAKVRIAHVLDTWKESIDEASAQLAERTQRATERGIDAALELISAGSRPPSASDLDREHVDWIFIGTHGRRGFRRLALGSWAEAVIRGARCPVISIGEGAPVGEPFSTIVVGVDLSPQSLLVVDQLRAIGKALGCSRFVVAHARPGPPELVQMFREQGGELPPPDLGSDAAGLEAVVESLRSDGFDARLVATSEGSADLILRVAREEKAGLIGVGTHSRRGFPHLLFGSIAEEVVRSAPCPVYTARLASARP